MRVLVTPVAPVSSVPTMCGAPCAPEPGSRCSTPSPTPVTSEPGGRWPTIRASAGEGRHPRPRDGRGRDARRSTWWSTSRGRAPRRPVDRGAAEFVQTNVLGTERCCRRRWNRRCPASCTSPPTRCTAPCDEGHWPEDHPLEPNSPTRPRRPSSDLHGQGLLPDPRPAGVDHPRLEQLWPPPVPREAHPAVRDEPLRRRAGAALRRRPQRARVAARGRPLPGVQAGRRPGAGSGRSTTSAAGSN